VELQMSVGDPTLTCPWWVQLMDIFNLHWLRRWSLSWDRKGGWKYMCTNFFPWVKEHYRLRQCL